jgi:hydroxymethylpyrimidine/phosphomethylpyrimidine kinase
VTGRTGSPAGRDRGEELFRLLVIGGSDSCGGAGIQADIKTAARFGVDTATVVTAVTAQNSLGVHALWPVPEASVAAQLESVCSDAPPHAVKLGMLCDGPRVRVVAAAIDRYRLHPIVCDPVLASTSGRILLDHDGRRELLALLPRLTLLTPNAVEAALLSGREVTDPVSLLEAGRALLDLGAAAVLLKGGHMGGDESTDFLLLGSQTDPIRHTAPRIATRNDHGTGCVLASAIAAALARGLSLTDAVTLAKTFLQQALLQSAPLWNGAGRGGMALVSSER